MKRAIAGIRRVPRLLKEAAGPKALILIYHRVAELTNDPWSLAVTPSHFAEHMEVVKKDYHSVQLKRLVAMLRQGKPQHRLIAITFDDGYVDIFNNVRPVMEQHNLPATIFLPAAFIGSQREFWWDALEWAFLQPGILPSELRLKIDAKIYAWELGGAAHYSAEDAVRYRNWTAREEPPTARHSIYRSLWELLYPLASEQRQETLDELLAWAGMETVARPTHRALSEEELFGLIQTGLFEAGAHTLTHPCLASLPAALQREEIRNSKMHLERLLGRPVTGFAYPYGKRHDYTSETVSLVQEAGYAYACTNFSGFIHRSVDCFQLPRLYIRDMDGEEFGQFLSAWVHPLKGALRS